MGLFSRENEDLLRAVDGILAQYTQPITVRQMFYRLVAAQLISNNLRQYVRVSRILTRARKTGRLRPDAFVDRTREVYSLPTWLGLEDFFNTVRRAYRRDIWHDQPEYVEVWLEKEALGAVFQPVCQERQVRLCITRGRPSFSYMHEALLRFAQQTVTDRSAVLLYFGDFDPTGEAIPENIDEEWLEPLRSKIDIRLVKVCLTAEQAEQYPHAFCKEKDPNTPRFIEKYGDVAVELDAIPPDELEQYVRDAIRQHTDQARRHQTIKKQREDIRRLEAIIGEQA